MLNEDNILRSSVVLKVKDSAAIAAVTEVVVVDRLNICEPSNI